MVFAIHSENVEIEISRYWKSSRIYWLPLSERTRTFRAAWLGMKALNICRSLLIVMTLTMAPCHAQA
jgi:hypothetical protein